MIKILNFLFLADVSVNVIFATLFRCSFDSSPFMNL